MNIIEIFIDNKQVPLDQKDGETWGSGRYCVLAVLW